MRPDLAEARRAACAPADEIPAMAAREAQLRVVILSDAQTGRNGVDGYYRDLVAHLRPRLGCIELLNPDPPQGPRNSLCSIPMPGDSTQRICMPAIGRLLRTIRAASPQAIVIPAPGPFGLLGLYAARRLGVPVIAGLHTDLEQLAALYWNRLTGALVQRYLEALTRGVFRRAHTVVVNSESMLPVARRLGAHRVALLGTPIAPAFIEPPASAPREPVRQVFYAGRLAPEKNIDGLLEAAARLPGLRFALAGSGPLQALVERRQHELGNLEYLGRLSREAVARQIDRADVLVLPSRVEAFGTIALEGLARNRCVLVSGGCGIVRWPALRGGLWVIEDGESLAEALRRLVQQPPELRRQIAATGCRQALALHQAAIDGWLTLLRGACR